MWKFGISTYQGRACVKAMRQDGAWNVQNVEDVRCGGVGKVGKDEARAR